MSIRLLIGALSVATVAASACAQRPATPQAADSATLHQIHHPAANDSTFAALQQRGKTAMGVDQYASRHQFVALPDGGRIILQQPGGDSAALGTIREHMRTIARDFSAGNFTTPMFVHDTADVPGTRVLAAKRSVVRYVYHALPDGAELRIYTTDADALKAIEEFMAFQRRDHRT